MRYNPATDRALSIDTIAEQCRQAITAPKALPPATKVHTKNTPADDVFGAEGCRTWQICQRCDALLLRDSARSEELDLVIARDLHRAMHHRPWQPEI